MANGNDENLISELLIHQLKNYWIDVDKIAIRKTVPIALQMMENNFKEINSTRFQVGGKAMFSPFMSVHWMIFLYRISNILYKMGGGYCCRSSLLSE